MGGAALAPQPNTSGFRRKRIVFGVGGYIFWAASGKPGRRLAAPTLVELCGSIV